MLIRRFICFRSR